MPILTTTQDGAIIINRINPTTTIDDIKQHIITHVNDWAESPVIWDLASLPVDSVSNDELRTFATDLAKKSTAMPGKKTAIVASDDLQFGLMRVFETFSNIDNFHIEFNIFRDIPSAKEWLLSK